MMELSELWEAAATPATCRAYFLEDDKVRQSLFTYLCCVRRTRTTCDSNWLSQLGKDLTKIIGALLYAATNLGRLGALRDYMSTRRPGFGGISKRMAINMAFSCRSVFRVMTDRQTGAIVFPAIMHPPPDMCWPCALLPERRSNPEKCKTKCKEHMVARHDGPHQFPHDKYAMKCCCPCLAYLMKLRKLSSSELIGFLDRDFDGVADVFTIEASIGFGLLSKYRYRPADVLYPDQLPFCKQ